MSAAPARVRLCLRHGGTPRNSRSAARFFAFRLVRAERARAHRPVEVTGERRLVGFDLLDRFAHAPLHRDARALGGCGGTPLATAEPERLRQRALERMDLLPHALGPAAVRE